MRIIFSGNVQGVFLRANAKKKADELGVKGWIRNLPDGRVEMVAEGKNVQQLIEFCKKYTKITKVEIKEGKTDCKDFQIRYHGMD
jgi:acylphosphatase